MTKETDNNNEPTTPQESGKPFETGMQEGLNSGDDTHKDRRERLLETTIKASSRKNVADIPAEDREALERHRAKRKKVKARRLQQ